MNKDIKVGDIVHVRRTVSEVKFDGTIMFSAYAKPEHVLRVEPRPIKVGDRVTGVGLRGTVHGIHDDRAWVLWDNEDVGYCSPCLDSLTRIDGEPS